MNWFIWSFGSYFRRNKHLPKQKIFLQSKHIRYCGFLSVEDNKSILKWKRHNILLYVNGLYFQSHRTATKMALRNKKYLQKWHQRHASDTCKPRGVHPIGVNAYIYKAVPCCPFLLKDRTPTSHIRFSAARSQLTRLYCGVKYLCLSTQLVIGEKWLSCLITIMP